MRKFSATEFDPMNLTWAERKRRTVRALMSLKADHQPRRQPAGFTMIEIMIVVVILAIVSAVALPMVGNRSDLKLAAATRRALADLQYAQSLSIATRQSVYIRFDTNTYSLCSRSGTTFTTIANPVDQMAFVVRSGATATDGQLRDITIAKPSFATASALGFDSLGAPFLINEASSVKTSLTSGITLTLSCGGQSQSLLIEPYTGEIAVP